jgi:ubiquinone/menaquinone biosynthesis C-methylase UbiE
VTLDPAENAAARFGAISRSFDERTKRLLQERGLAAGWRCLEAGGGGGSIARWLSDQVGEDGHIVATDVDTRLLEAIQRPNVEVVRHDITRDPLPHAAFDLAHTRMLLIHLPEPDEVLGRLASALKPGGWLVCEEFDSASAAFDVQTSPDEVLLKTHAAMGQLRRDRGGDLRYGRRLYSRFRSLGLTDLGADGYISIVRRGSPVSTLLRASYQLRRTAMIDAGYITEDEFDADLARMDSSDFMMPSPTMWTVWGRKP